MNHPKMKKQSSKQTSKKKKNNNKKDMQKLQQTPFNYNLFFLSRKGKTYKQ